MINSVPYFGFSTTFLMVIFQTIYPTLFKYLLFSMPAAPRPAFGGDTRIHATGWGSILHRQWGVRITHYRVGMSLIETTRCRAATMPPGSSRLPPLGVRQEPHWVSGLSEIPWGSDSVSSVRIPALSSTPPVETGVGCSLSVHPIADNRRRIDQ